MKRINLLDQNTSNKIAAGEVVERPSSVVKELVENSIDAGAKNITIEIEEGGCTLIRIVDDGNGIHPDDVKKAFLPHATSKIKSVDDIFTIETLGFRGEALASIASVAKVNLKTKIKDSEFGREISIHGGEILEEKDCGCNEGTTIEVKDIFYNVPARKKFLKSSKREGSIISDIINRIALSNPEISFKLFNNGKKILNTFGRGDYKDVIRAVYSKSISDEVLYFSSDRDIVSVSGYIGREEIARGSRNNQSIFVNGRYIKNKTMVAAVENAFKSFSTVNKFPFFVLFINIYPEFVDVNIHPTKAEIKFKDDRLIFKTVFDAVHKALKDDVFETFKIPEEEKSDVEKSYENLAFNISSPEEEVRFNSFEKNLKISKFDDHKLLSKEIDKEMLELESLKDRLNKNPIDKKENLIKTEESTFINEEKLSKGYNINLSLTEKNIKEDVKKEELSKDIEEHKDEVAKFPPIRIIGQFNKTYILGEFNDILYLIDQHAAHEKILFEKYMKDIKSRDIIIQPLLVPALINLTVDDIDIYEQNKDIFINSGFTVEDFGGNTLALKEIPYFLGKLDPKDLFLNIIDNLKNLGSGKTEEIKYNKIATMACKAAVKGNDTLNEQEMIKLVQTLRFIDDPFHCPHGRPTIIKFTNNDLEKKFRRIV